MLTQPRQPNTQKLQIPTTPLTRKLPAAAVFSVVRQSAIPVPRVSAKGASNDATDKARSSNLPVRYLKMGIPGQTLWNRSSPQISSSQTKAAVQIKSDIHLQPSILPLLAALGVLHQRDSLLPRDHAHPLVASFQNNHPTELRSNNQALPAPLLRSHIHLPSHRVEWALRDIPRRPVKQFHPRHCLPHL